MPEFGGWCASKILQSAVYLEIGNGHTCSSRETKVTDMLEMTEAPESGHTGIRAFPLRKGGGINSPDEVCLHQCMQHEQQTG